MKRFATAGVIVAALVLTSTLASAQSAPEERLKYLSEDTRIVVSGDVDAVRDTTLYKHTVAFLETVPDDEYITKAVFAHIGFDPRKDLKHVLIGVADPYTEPDGTQDEPYTMVMEGDFELAEFDKRVEEDERMTRKKVGAVDVVVFNEDHQVSFVDEHTAIFVFGPDEYTQKVWKVVDGKAKSVTKQKIFSKLKGKADTSKHLWVVADMSHQHQASGPKWGQVVFSVNAADGLEASGQVIMADKKKADALLKKWEAESTQRILMMQMLRGEALLMNLELKREGETIGFETSMTDAQLDAMLAKFIQVSQAQQAMEKAEESESAQRP